MYRCQTVPNSTTLNDLRQPTNYLSDKHVSPSVPQYVAKLVEGAGIQGVQVAERPLHASPPWTLLHQEINPSLPNLSKRDDPNLLGASAREYIEDRYNESCKIYTDGSLSDEGVGAAFYAPSFNYIKKFELPAVSIFTAELIAILMSLHYIQTNGPNRNWVILSDSKSVLDSLHIDGTSSREDLIRAAVSELSKLKKNEINVSLQWIPSHVGIAGNEIVDRAAKEAARGRGALRLDLPLSLNDVKSRLRQEAWADWGRSFREITSSRDTIDNSPPTRDGVHFPSVPLAVVHVMHRLRCNAWRARHLKVKCSCGADLSPRHVIFSCQLFENTFKPVIELCGSPQGMKDLMSLHPALGWRPAVMTSKAIMNCEIGKYF
jgi:ribonuclease HI